ncbi:MAG: sodium/proline symporter PutP [Lachnospiraceae bacterium]|nr:sodium/proline symporter PutP [Lachnospiraceae bacterium]MDE6626364.1 sodium/proline symporter PutP [Lachnospiraceae bacterium]
MSSSIIWVLLAFAAYMIVMVVIGAVYAGKTKSSEDFFLGGRNLNGWVAALSAQASDMSGWLLMGLPGSIYAFGTGQAWIAVGLFIGTVCNWLFIASRLRRYTIRANNSLTLPAYLENRFHDKKRILLVASSVVIVIFFLVYTASALTAGGKLFASVFGVDYRVALTIGAVVILIYTFLGGFMAVCTTDFIQGTLMLVGVLVVPIVAYAFVGPDNLVSVLNTSGVAGGASSYLNVMHDSGAPVSAVYIISQLAWGFGYCGMPHILVRFMAVANEKELKKSKIIAIIWVAISLSFAVIIGIVGRAYLYPTILGDTTDISAENVFIETIKKIFMSDLNLAFVGGLLLCGILAAIMSTADSQLLVTASAVAEDLFKGIFKKDAEDKTVLNVSRITVVVVAVLAYIIALNPDSSVMGLVSNAWAGFGSAFGPIVLLSLYWKRVNLPGAIAGIVSGAATVIIWDYIPIIGGQTLGAVTGLYSLALGFLISLLLIVIVSLATKAPSEEILKEFDDMRNNNL